MKTMKTKDGNLRNCEVGRFSSELYASGTWEKNMVSKEKKQD